MVDIKIEESYLSCFFATLGIGVLRAIRDGALPAQEGIWTLGRPRTWKHLVGRVPKEIVDVYSIADELSSIEAALGREYLVGQIDTMIADLEGVLKRLENPSWLITVIIDDDSNDSGRRT